MIKQDVPVIIKEFISRQKDFMLILTETRSSCKFFFIYILGSELSLDLWTKRDFLNILFFYINISDFSLP